MSEVNWKRKLAAYLHDPPSKVLDIPNHQQLAAILYRQAGFNDEEVGEYDRVADWTASAADRFPFPNSQASGLRCHFDGVRNAFHHPLGGAENGKGLVAPFAGEFITADLAHETDETIQPIIANFGGITDERLRWRARFFCHWRLWRKHAIERDGRFAFLPADTRLPDHSIWTHMQVVSALAGTPTSDDPKAPLAPAFLKLQVGPVQEFIAQARSTRDLWSGSYLLSWLMAAGLKKVSELAGPDAVIYPSLFNQPLFDLHWREELWSQVKIGGHSVWDGLKYKDEELLTPNLPNVFLSIVPLDAASEIAREVEDAIRMEWKAIAEAVWNYCDQAGLTRDEDAITKEERRVRFDRQIERFVSVSWQVTPWFPSAKEAIQTCRDGKLPFAEGQNNVVDRIDAIARAVTIEMPKDHRDRRYYTNDDKSELNNVGLAWSVVTALNSWELDGVRQVRNFLGWNFGGWEGAASNNKDALNGRDEAIAGGREWFKRSEGKGAPLQNLFKHDDWLGAATLVKRLWHLAYLKVKWNLKPLPMPDTRHIANHDPFRNSDDDEDVQKLPDEPCGGRYFAVLALDGDEIGKWVSGDKAPELRSQLADYKDGSGQQQGSLRYFEQTMSELVKVRRPVSPSYHLQFSEALGNFAQECARPIVEAFDGRLIYSGGDDVLALLPADSALPCAVALRMAFTGQTNLKTFLQERASGLRARHEREQRRNPQTIDAPYYQKLAAEGCLLESRHAGFLGRADHVDQQNCR